VSAIHLSLVSHTNVGKTTLARTLLGRDVGEVRDAPHVTEFADAHVLLRSADGDELTLWDTPGFGDSVRLAAPAARQQQPAGLVPVRGVGPLARPRLLGQPAGAAPRARAQRRAAVPGERVRTAGGRGLRGRRDGPAGLGGQAGAGAAEPAGPAARRGGRSRPTCGLARSPGPLAAGAVGAAAGRLCALLGAGRLAVAGGAGGAAGRPPGHDGTAACRLGGAAAGSSSTPPCRPWPRRWRRWLLLREPLPPPAGAARCAAPGRRRAGPAGGRAQRAAGRRGTGWWRRPTRRRQAPTPCCHCTAWPARPAKPWRSAWRCSCRRGCACPKARRLVGRGGQRRTGRPGGRHRRRRADAGRRPAGRRAAGRPGRRRRGPWPERGARHRPQLGGLERRGAGAAAAGCAAALPGGGPLRPRPWRLGRRRSAAALGRRGGLRCWQPEAAALAALRDLDADATTAALQPLLARCTRGALARLYPGAAPAAANNPAP
jgi:hypothetical protein